MSIDEWAELNKITLGEPKKEVKCINLPSDWEEEDDEEREDEEE